MPNDVLALGPFLFTDFAVPETLPGGGKQQLRVHKLPGGDRIVDAMGPDDDDRSFEVLHVGSGSADDVLLLDQMRISGLPYPYSNGMEARIVVIASHTWKVEKFPNVIHSSLTLTPVDNPGGSGAAVSSIDSLIGSDLGGASGVAADNVASSVPLGQGGIGHA